MVNLFAWKTHTHTAADVVSGTLDPLRLPVVPIPHARFTVGSGITVSATTWTAAPFNTTVDASTSPPYTLNVVAKTISINQPGVYLLSTVISASAGSFAIRILASGVTLAQTAVATGVSLTQSLDRCVRLASGVAVSVEVYTSTSSGISTDGSSFPSSISITRLGD